MAFCNACGKSVDDSAKFCGECGAERQAGRGWLGISPPVRSAARIGALVYAVYYSLPFYGVIPKHQMPQIPDWMHVIGVAAIGVVIYDWWQKHVVANHRRGRDGGPQKSPTLLRVLAVSGIAIGALGCSTKPSVDEVKVYVEKAHRNMARVVGLTIAHKKFSDPLGMVETFAVEYQADVEWLETVKYQPAYRAPIVGLAASMFCTTPTVLRRGDSPSGLGALMDPEAYWSSGPGEVVTKGQRTRVSGLSYYERSSTAWKWACPL